MAVSLQLRGRDLNPRPSGYEGDTGGLGEARNPSQRVANRGVVEGSDSRRSPGLAGSSNRFAAHLLHGDRETEPQSRGLVAAAAPLLSTREVADRLSVSRATVYKLVEQGDLPHVRVLNSIRVRPADLAAYLDGSAK